MGEPTARQEVETWLLRFQVHSEGLETDKSEPLLDRLSDALAVLAEFAQRAPIAGSEIDSTPQCSYCSGEFVRTEQEHDPEQHDGDCTWRRAREALSALRREQS